MWGARDQSHSCRRRQIARGINANIGATRRRAGGSQAMSLPLSRVHGPPDRLGGGGQWRRRQALGHPPMHEAGPHDEDAHAVWCQPVSQAAGKGIETRLACTVEVVGHTRPQGGDRGQHHESAVPLLA